MFIQGKSWGQNLSVYKQLISWGISLYFRDQQASNVLQAAIETKKCLWPELQ